MKKNHRYSESGVAITLVLIAVIVISAFASYALMIGFNHRTVMNTHVKNRTQAYYSAQAGMVDANWRIRNNVLTNNAGALIITGVGAGAQDFTNPLFNPNPYCLHVEGGNNMNNLNVALDDIHVNTQMINGQLRCVPTTDILVDISQVGATVANVRTIVSRGHTSDIDGA